MTLHVIQHIGIEGPGIIADWARRRGYSIATTHLYRGDPLPDPAAVDFLVLMGGPMNIYQDRDFPWLPAERAWLRDYLKSGQPAVGICLGAQLLADALGARVTQNPAVEIGWFPLHFSHEARARFPFLPPSLEMLHWHGDTFELPPGALLLGSSEACVNQGFLHHDHVLGLQFHPEMTHAGATLLAESEAATLTPATYIQSAPEILAKPADTYRSAHELLGKMLDLLKS